MRDARDLVIDALAVDELGAVDLAAIWREIAHAAIHELATQRLRLVQQERTIAALRDEVRRVASDRVSEAAA